ncbi:MAG: hypothetical protein J6C64_05135 [Lachnospiraceae bacterium]|nr:hypothetical protein [Lachnospiraceae bacterium]
MRNKYYWITTGGILLVTIFFVKIYKAGTEMKEDTNKIYSISEFQNMNYYILCDTALNSEVTDIVHTYGIYGEDADDFNKGTKLYQEYKATFWENMGIYEDKTGDSIVYISPDCKWIITENMCGENEYGEVLRQQTLYYEGNMKRQIVSTYSGISPVTVIKDEIEYKEIEEQIYQKYINLKNRSYKEKYYKGLLVNDNGNLAVGIKEGLNERLDIWNIEMQEIVWSLMLTDIQDKVWSEVIQFYGDDNEGKIIIRCNRNFYEIGYPSGDIKLLGKDMYSLSYSPDRKYIVYSSIDNETGMELEPYEIEEFLSGIYIQEIETNKIAYIECQNEWWQLSRRNFYWIEKDAINQYLEQ